MARAFLYDLQVDDGFVRAFSLDTLAADDLPRPTPDPAGNYLAAAVDQYGRVVSAGVLDAYAVVGRNDPAAGVPAAVAVADPGGTTGGPAALVWDGGGAGLRFEQGDRTLPGFLGYNADDHIALWVQGEGAFYTNGNAPAVGTLPLSAGGTGADLSAAGPGLVYQAALGDPLTVVTTIAGAYTAVADAKTSTPWTTKRVSSAQTAPLLKCVDETGVSLLSFAGVVGSSVLTLAIPSDGSGGSAGLSLWNDGSERWNIRSRGAIGYDFEFDRSGFAAVLRIEYASPYRVGIGANTGTFAAALKVESTATTTTTLVLKDKASQTAALLDCQDSGGTTLLQVRANGTLQPVHLADASAANDSVYYSTDAGKLVYKDSGGTVNNLY